MIQLRIIEAALVVRGGQREEGRLATGELEHGGSRHAGSLHEVAVGVLGGSPRFLHSTVTAQGRPWTPGNGTIGVMNTASFLDTAETRATHLRELSNSLRALEWTNAVRRDIDHEIPEIEVAMAVYKRLGAEGFKPDDALGAWEFLRDADARADHLRQASHHMHSLEWVHASLIEVEHEIPDLELAISVYRRLSAVANERLARSGATSSGGAAADAPVVPPAPAEDVETPSAPASTFRQFVMTQADTNTPEITEEPRLLEAAASPTANGTQ
jgi:ribosomal protein L24E